MLLWSPACAIPRVMKSRGPDLGRKLTFPMPGSGVGVPRDRGWCRQENLSPREAEQQSRLCQHHRPEPPRLLPPLLTSSPTGQEQTFRRSPGCSHLRFGGER